MRASEPFHEANERLRERKRIENDRDAEIESLQAEVERLRDDLEKSNAREREAFVAGLNYGVGFPDHDHDIDQAWQQYRCQDDTDWKKND